VNKLVYFSMNAEGGSTKANLEENTIRVRDAFIGLKFADEFRVQAGVMRAPFSRTALTSAYAQLFPYTPPYGALAISPTHVGGGLSPRDHGIVVWGNVADGMLKYYLGVTDGETIGSSTDDKLAYTIRLQFTPTMLGYKPETGYTVSDTYLGRQNVLSIGVGYRVVGRSGNNVRDTKMWTVDVLYEQKFGDIVPNLQVGYINQKDAKYGTPARYDGEATQIYAQAQLLFDQMMGFGKPALAIRLEQNQNKIPAASANQDEPKVTRLGVWTHYYIKGQAAKVSLGVDSVSLNSEARNRNCVSTHKCRNFTDITLQFQTQF